MQGREVDALVLRSVAYGEADRVITLFCLDLGCLAVIARGARKSQRRFGGGLDFGTLGRAALRLLPGRDLGQLERFDVVRRPARFGDDLARMAHGAYAAELVSRLAAPHHAENDLFAWTSAFLAVLDAQGATAPRLRTFELGLLRALGLAPVLDRCAVCGRSFAPTTDPATANRLRWSPEAGGAACGACVDRARPLSESTRQTLLQLQEAPLEEGANVPPEVNRACREALAEIFAQHLNGPLKSVEFIHKMEAAETRAPAIYPPPLSQ